MPGLWPRFAETQTEAFFCLQITGWITLILLVQSDSIPMSEDSSSPIDLTPAHRPQLISRKKKTVFVFEKEEGKNGELEEEEFADDFYDFTEIDTKFRIVSDLED